VQLLRSIDVDAPPLHYLLMIHGLNTLLI
jgi:hypothetical protein